MYGARVRRSPLPLVHQRLTLLLPLGFLPLLVAPSMAVMALLLVPAGLFIAPIIATRNELASQAAPAGTKTEALTWPLTALVGGIALGRGGRWRADRRVRLACGRDGGGAERVCRARWCATCAPLLAAAAVASPRRWLDGARLSSRTADGEAQAPRARADSCPDHATTATPRATCSRCATRCPPGTVAKLREPVGGAAASADDMWRRRTEMLFERFAVRWTIAGLPLNGQKELLGRYRLADEATQRWVRQTHRRAPAPPPPRAAGRTVRSRVQGDMAVIGRASLLAWICAPRVGPRGSCLVRSGDPGQSNLPNRQRPHRGRKKELHIVFAVIRRARRVTAP